MQWSVLLAAVIALSAAELRAGVALAPETQPATMPADDDNPEDIDALVRQLGSESFTEREAATRRLLEIGRPALEALKAAARSDDAEVRARAELLIAQIGIGALPDNPDSLPPSVTVTVNQGRKRVEVDEHRRKIRIDEAAGSIHLEITTQTGEHRGTERYDARNEAELRDKHPLAWRVYRRWGGGEGPVWRKAGIIQQAGTFHSDALVGASSEADALEDRLTAWMEKKKLPVDQQQRVFDMLDKLDTDRSAMGAGGVAATTEAYLKRSDELRALLDSLKLPVPDDLLPPPASSRLGVRLASTITEEDDQVGLVVEDVMAGSRGEKVGLKDGDVIRTANGEATHTVADLRRLVAKPGKLRLGIERDGKPVELAEK